MRYIVLSTRPSWVAVFLLALAMLLTPTRISNAAPLTTIVVNSLADTAANDGVCTLREAITSANMNTTSGALPGECPAGVSGLDTIGFSMTGVITLGSSLPAINEDLTIYSSPSGSTVSGNNAVRVLTVNSGKTLNLFNLTIVNGLGVADCGGLTCGGGIKNDGGSVTIMDSAFSGNSASSGGAIYNSGTANIANSTFSSNTASYGGAIYNAGTLNVTNSTFSSNFSGFGGAIYIQDATANVTNSTFVGNHVGNGGFGGAIGTNGASTLSVTNSTLSGNYTGPSGLSRGGGVFNYSTGNILNTTFSGNTSNAYGGGLDNLGLLTITNSTFSGNNAPGGAISTGGGYTATLQNTIVANTPSGVNCYGTITNGGNNLEDGATCGWGSASGSLSSTNSMLGSLNYNGGSTQTYALLPGSPAINAANLLNCPPTDQRGVYRLFDGKCDIGAFEAPVYPKLFLPLILR